jgi:glucan biosynthesis protein C
LITDAAKHGTIGTVERSTTRLLFIDNVRWTMIVLVLSMHSADTYSPFGNWYYTDRTPLSLSERVLFATYQSWLQAFFMALLFFVAAYFTPGSYDRKGAVQYISDRLMRLMLPTLFYIFLIGPPTEYYISKTWTGAGGFLHQWLEHVTDGEWISGTGPMWFCVVLFVFSLAYACARRMTEGRSRFRPLVIVAAPPSPLMSLAFVLTIAIASFVVRIFAPSGTSIINVHPGDVPQYALMFVAGLLAGRGKWLERALPRTMLGLSLGALAVAAALWTFMVARAARYPDSTGLFDGGLNLLSALKCFWEALVCVGVSYLLLALYRRYFDRQGPTARFLSRNAFAVYLFHPPVIICAAILLHGVSLSALGKTVLLTLIAAGATFSLSSLILRRIPYLRAVL